MNIIENGDGSQLKKAIICAFLSALSFFNSGLVIFIFRALPSPEGDGLRYFRLAQSGPAGIVEPFAKRLLHPFLAKVAATLFHTDLNHGFLIVQVLLGLCFGILLGLHILDNQPLQRISRFNLLLIALGLSPLLYPIFRHWSKSIYMPELLSAVLVAAYAYTERRKRAWWSAFFLFLLVFARSSAAVLLLLSGAIVTLITEEEWRVLLPPSFAFFGGVLLLALLTRDSAGNPENLPTFVYLAMKIPYNFVKNIFGLYFVTDAIWKCTPTAVWNIPQAFQVGNMTKIGFCEWSPMSPLFVLVTFVTQLGLGPILSCQAIRCFEHLKKWQRKMLAYGIASFLLGTMSGAGVARLMSYGWPILLVSSAVLMDIEPVLDRDGVIISVISLVLAYLPMSSSFLFDSLSTDSGSNHFIRFCVIAFIGLLAQFFVGWRYPLSPYLSVLRTLDADNLS